MIGSIDPVFGEHLHATSFLCNDRTQLGVPSAEKSIGITSVAYSSKMALQTPGTQFDMVLPCSVLIDDGFANFRDKI